MHLTSKFCEFYIVSLFKFGTLPSETDAKRWCFEFNIFDLFTAKEMPTYSVLSMSTQRTAPVQWIFGCAVAPQGFLTEQNIPSLN